MKSNKNSFCNNIKSKINKKYAIIIGVSAIILIIIIIVIVAIATYPNGKGKGAYLSVPDPKDFQYRLGDGGGLYSNGWIQKQAMLSSMAGCDGSRKKYT